MLSIARLSVEIGSVPVFSSIVLRASYTIFSAVERLPRCMILLTIWVTRTDR